MINIPVRNRIHPVRSSTRQVPPLTGFLSWKPAFVDRKKLLQYTKYIRIFSQYGKFLLFCGNSYNRILLTEAGSHCGVRKGIR